MTISWFSSQSKNIFIFPSQWCKLACFHGEKWVFFIRIRQIDHSDVNCHVVTLKNACFSYWQGKLSQWYKAFLSTKELFFYSWQFHVFYQRVRQFSLFHHSDVNLHVFMVKNGCFSWGSGKFSQCINFITIIKS